jgi:uncharacterized repeat protein (TIGR01451 family)
MKSIACQKFNRRTRQLGVCVFALLLLPQIAWAFGTPSNTPITSTATVSYSMGGPQPDIVRSVTVTVDELVNLTVLGGTTTNVLPGSAQQATPFTVTNTSNSPLDFSLTPNWVIPTVDNFDPVTSPTSCVARVESNAAADGYQPATDVAFFIDELPTESSRVVYVVCDIPGTTAVGNTALVGLLAAAQGNFAAVALPATNGAYVATPGALGAPLVPTMAAETMGVVDIVFADIQGVEVGLEIARDAKHSARNTYSVGSILTLNKSVGVVDPAGGSTIMPGAVMTYRIEAILTGPVTNFVVTDPLPANSTYVAGSMLVNGVAKTDAADADNAEFLPATSTVSVVLGTVAAPATVVITFRATIN